jgi:hypothetical protein
MKIANFVYGQFRQLDIAVKSWNFLHEIDCDTYVSTWDKSIQYSYYLNIFDEFDVTEEMIYNLLPNSTISIINEYEYDIQNYGDYQPRCYVRNSKKTYFHWKNCLRMLKNSGKKYDLIMLNRTDNYFFSQKPYEEYFNIEDKKNIFNHSTDNRGIFLSENNNYTVNDLFFIGNFDLMSNIIENVPKIEKLLHDDFAKYLMSINVEVKTLKNLEISTLRPNIKNFDGELTPENILKIAKTWA